MKTKYWICIIGAVLLMCVGLSIPLLIPRDAATEAEIYLNGKLYQTVDLRVDQEFRVETEDGYNVVTVSDGKIAVTEADCPDHHCMNRGFCDRGTAIVCLPNKLVIEFVNGQEIDGAVG